MKDITKISGIYKIVNRIDGKYYVGSSQDIGKRWKSHVNELKRNRHWNIHLQRSWNKYGNENFKFVICKECPVYRLFECEQEELNRITVETSYNINLSSFSPMRGKHHSKDSKLKLSISHKGKLRSEEHRLNLSKSLKGKYVGKLHPQFGKQLSLQHKLKISKSNSGKIRNPQSKILMSKAKSGSKHPNYNHTTYKFFNKTTNIIEKCTKHELEKKYNLVQSNVVRIITKERKSHRGWTVV